MNRYEVVTRDDAGLGEAYGLHEYRLPRTAAWPLIADELAARPGVLGVRFERGAERVLCMTDKSVLKGPLPVAEVAGCTVRPHRASWSALSDRELLSLLLNSLASGFDGAANLAGRMYVRVRPPKGYGDKRVVCCVVRVETDMRVTVNVATFFPRGLLLGRAKGDAEELKKIKSMPCYVKRPGGTMRRAVRGDKDSAFYVQRSYAGAKKSRVPLMALKGAGRAANTKLGVLARALNGLEDRYGRFLAIRPQAFERVATLGEGTGTLYERAYLAPVVSALAGREVFVSSPRGTGLKRLARAFADKWNSIGSDALPKAVYWGGGDARRPEGPAIEVVGNLVDGKAGYSVDPARPVQHVTKDYAESFLVDDAKRTVRSASSLSKELAVKVDVAAGRIQAFNWAASGLRGAIDFATAVEYPAPEGDAAPTICHLVVNPDGNMRFYSRRAQPCLDPLEAFQDDSLFEDDGEGSVRPSTAKLAIRAVESGSVSLIEPTGLITIPNDVKGLCALVEEGASVRTAAFYRDPSSALYPLMLISAWEAEGGLCYAVGQSPHLREAISRASPVRVIRTLTGEDLSERLLSLLDVGLARLKQPTVWPVTRKYLLEYARRDGAFVGEQLSMFGPDEG